VKVTAAALPDVKLIEPALFEDARGFFIESWNARGFAAAGIEQAFVQDNHSRSGKSVLRGLHYQVGRPQGKLVRVVAGRAFDVVVDLRRSSPSFGEWTGVELSAGNRHMLWVPAGFAHGFLALEEGTDLLYKCTDYYAPELERTLLWSDPELAIAWPLPGGSAPILSAKDEAGLLLRDAETFA
jgi:dTDP-4-dehydrorhamnose 3,5-epimerase